MAVESFIRSVLPSVKSGHLLPAAIFRLDHLWEGRNQEQRTDDFQNIAVIFVWRKTYGLPTFERQPTRARP
jgi:hypothetical protein